MEIRHDSPFGHSPFEPGSLPWPLCRRAISGASAAFVERGRAGYAVPDGGAVRLPAAPRPCLELGPAGADGFLCGDQDVAVRVVPVQGLEYSTAEKRRGICVECVVLTRGRGEFIRGQFLSGCGAAADGVCRKLGRASPGHLRRRARTVFGLAIVFCTGQYGRSGATAQRNFPPERERGTGLRRPTLQAEDWLLQLN